MTAPTVSAGRVLARTAAAEWTRLWTVRTTWWFLAAAAVTTIGIGTLAGSEAASDPDPPQATRRGWCRRSARCRRSSRCSGSR